MKMSALVLAVLTFTACNQSPSGPSMSAVAITASEMTLTITTTEPLIISRLVVTGGGIVRDIEVTSEDNISWIASRVANDKFDLAGAEPVGPAPMIVRPISVPEGTSAIRLYVFGGGRGDVWFATNPADWVAHNKAGRVVQLPDQEVRLHLTTTISILVNGVSGVDRPVTHIAKGSCVTLSWTSQDATECWAEGYWPNKNGSKPGNAQPLAGTEEVCPTEYSSYVLKCRGPGGSVGQVVFVSPQ